MSEPVAQMLERLTEIDKRRREAGTQWLSRVAQHEWESEVLEAAPRLLALVRCGYELAEALRADHESTPREDGALVAWDREASRGAGTKEGDGG